MVAAVVVAVVAAVVVAVVAALVVAVVVSVVGEVAVDSWEMEVPTNLVMKSSVRFIVDSGGLPIRIESIHGMTKPYFARYRRPIRFHMLRPSEIL